MALVGKKELGQLVKNNNTKAGVFYLVGNLFNNAISFLTIPVFTRMLSTDEYGIYTTYSSWVSILAVIVGLSLGNTIRTAYVDYKDKLDEYISSVTTLSLMSMAVILVTGLLAGYISDGNIVLILFCVIQAFLSNLTSTYAIKYMMELNYIKRTLLLALPNAVGMVVSLPVIYFMRQNRYMGRILVQVIVYLIIGGIVLVHIYKKGKMRPCIQYWKYAVPLAIPMIFHGISVNLLSDRIMITYFKNASETGVYGLIYSMSMLAGVITSAMENVWIPWFTNKLMAGEREIINQRVKSYIGFTTLLLCGFMLVVPEVLMLMSTEEYWDGKWMLPPLVVAYFFIFLASISIQAEYFYKKTKYIAVNTLTAGIINITLNLVWVPKYGALAAAYTTLLSYIVSFTLHYVQCKKMDNGLFPFYAYIVSMFVCLGIMIYTIVFMNCWQMRWMMAIIICLLYGLALLWKLKKRD